MKEFEFVVSSATSTVGGGLPVIVRAKSAEKALAKLATIVDMEKVTNIKFVTVRG